MTQSAKASPQVRRRALLALAIIFGFWPVLIVYSMLPSHIWSALCPERTFLAGHIGSDIVVAVGVVLLMFLWLTSPFVLGPGPRDTDKRRHHFPEFVRRHRRAFGLAGGCAAVATPIIWVIYCGQYFCMLPENVSIKPDVWTPAHVLNWQDVRTVHARCAASRGGRAAIVMIEFADGERLNAELGRSSLVQHANAIRSALAGHPYRYDVARMNECDDQQYNLFMNWMAPIV